MELKPGYKQTEVGVIPQDWHVENMLDISSQIMDYRGRTPKKLGMAWGGGEIPALSAGNVKRGYIDFSAECYLASSELYKRWMTRGDVSRDDIVFTTEAPLGNVALVPDDRKYILSQRTILLQVDRHRISSKYLFQVMLSDAFQKVLLDNASGSTAKGIQRKKFEKLCVAVPQIKEQQAIAAALSDVDALLATLDQLIAKKRDIKQATMQQLLTGKQRLSGFNGEWTEARLVDVAQLVRESVTPAYFPEKLFVHFSLPAFDAGRTPVIETGSAIGSNKFKVPEDAILVSKLNPRIPRVWAIDDIPDDSVASTEFLVLLPTERVSRSFLYVLCSSPRFCGQMELSATGTTGSHQRIAPGDVLQIPVLMPTNKDEQVAIASVLSDMDTEIAVLEQKRDKALALKQGMMQELLTGRIRLV